MQVKEKFFKPIVKKKKLIFQSFLIFLIFTNNCLADLQKDLINKLTATKTLSFNFKQIIEEKEETGKCFIKYPMLMKCDYQNLKQKSIISNGRTVAIIKKKYKKIYLYPIGKTQLSTILKKEKILALIRNSKPSITKTNTIKYEFIDKKSNKLQMFFDKNSLELKGWETTDAYSNNVIFEINNIKVNEIIDDEFFTIPKEEDL